MVISARNPVHSVLFLILAFFNAAALFVLMGAEFLAMVLVIVYVGAVAVLFLFVVMMLNINYVELRQGFLQYLPIGALIGIILLVELVFVFGAWVIAPGGFAPPRFQPKGKLDGMVFRCSIGAGDRRGKVEWTRSYCEQAKAAGADTRTDVREGFDRHAFPPDFRGTFVGWAKRTLR